jgi:hypothetical protein
MTNDNQTVAMGAHGSYQWLATGQYELASFLRHCPQALLSKYVAVTWLDSGSVVLREEEKIAGWQSRNDIAYSPLIHSPEKLRHGGFDEWYIFDSPKELGQLWHGNVFETPTTTSHIATFVNFGDFAPHNPELQELISLFWEQLERIQPESYVADGNAFLTFVSRDKQIFAAVHQAISVIPAASDSTPL